MKNNMINLIRSIAPPLLNFIPGYSLFKPQRIVFKENKDGFTIQNINVIDMVKEKKPMLADVMIKGNRIVDIHPSGSEQGILGQKINGKGKYLIPALIDSHCHIVNFMYPWMAPLYMAAGVTAVRDMATPQKKWRELGSGNIHDESFLGPRIFPVAGFFDGPPGVFGWAILPKNEKEVSRYVDELFDYGINALKIYSYMPPEILKLIVKSAKPKNIHIAGHIPLALDMYQAAEIGMHEFEHNLGVPETLLSIKDTNFNKNIRLQGHYWNQLKDKDKEMQELAMNMSKKGIINVPTFNVARGMGYTNLPDLKIDKRLDYLPSIFPDLIWSLKFPAFNQWNDNDFAAQRNVINISGRYTRYLKEAGGTILAGTDTPMGFGIPGFSLLDELNWLVTYANFSPYEALSSATVLPAKVMRANNDLGMIKQGMLADMLILDQNPLENIKAVSKINTIIFNGKIAEYQEIKSKLNKMAENYSGFIAQFILNPTFRMLFDLIVRRFIPPPKTR
ncbi:MAG: amidohydrolase family protein [Desulfobacterales bacterium]|nr:amidohydrolase family protein [Desulfobacterales bacterium]